MAKKQEGTKSLNRLALKAGLFYVISQLFVRGITFLTTPVFTRLLTNEQYNQVQIFESWLLLFAPVMSLCLWRSVERAKYDVRERFNAFTSSVQTLSYLSIAFFSLLFLIFRKPVGEFCSMTDLMLVIALLYTFAHTSIYYYQRREKQMMRYKASTLFTALTVVPATLLSVVLVSWGKGAGYGEHLVILRILGYYVPMILGGFTVAVLMLIQGKKFIQLQYWRYALKFSLPLIPEVISIQIMNQADKLMVTAMAGDYDGSIFSLATKVSYVIWILEDSIWNAWLPWMYEKISRGQEGEIRPSWQVLMHGFGVFSWYLVLFAPEIILILGGKNYAPAVYLIAPMVTGTLFRFYSNSYTAIQNYYKKTGFVAVSTVSVMFLNVFLNYVCILLFGYQAAAYTTAFCYLVLLVMQALMEKHISGKQLIPLGNTLKVSCGYFLLCLLTMISFGFGSLVRFLIAAVTLPLLGRHFLPQLKSILKNFRK